MYFLQTISVHHYSVTSRTGLLGRRLSNHNGDIHSFAFQVFNGCIVEAWILLARLQKNLRIFCFQITGSLDNLLWSARVRVVKENKSVCRIFVRISGFWGLIVKSSPYSIIYNYWTRYRKFSSLIVFSFNYFLVLSRKQIAWILANETLLPLRMRMKTSFARTWNFVILARKACPVTPPLRSVKIPVKKYFFYYD